MTPGRPGRPSTASGYVLSLARRTADRARRGAKRLLTRRPNQEPLTGVPPPPPAELVDCLRRFGVALCLSDGMTDRVQLQLKELSAAWGVRRVDFFVIPTGVFVRIRSGDTTALDFAPAEGEPLRLDQIGRLYELMARLRRDPPEPSEAVRQLAEILDSGPRFNIAMQILGHAVLTLGLGLVQGGDPRALLAYLVLGAFVGVLRVVAVRTETLSLVLPVVAAACVTALVAGLGDWARLEDPWQVLIPSLVTFLPGAALTQGALELAAGSKISGTSRMVSGAFTLLLLTFGILAGAYAMGTGSPDIDVDTVSLGAWAPLLGVLVFGVGQYLHFSAPARSLPWALLVLYTVWAAQQAGGAIGNGILGSFLGGLVTPLLTSLIEGRNADRAKAHGRPPAQVLFLPAFWLLVPGATSLAGLSELVTGSPTGGWADLTNAGLTVMAIALGVLVGASLLQRRSVPPAALHG